MIQYLYVLGRSVMSDSLRPHGLTRQAPLSMGILQARTLEWVAMPSSRVSSQPRDRTQVSRIAGRLLTVYATRKEICIYYKMTTTISLVNIYHHIVKIFFSHNENFNDLLS